MKFVNAYCEIVVIHNWKWKWISATLCNKRYYAIRKTENWIETIRDVCTKIEIKQMKIWLTNLYYNLRIKV